MSVWSRRASRQIAQTSSSVRFPHSLQKRTRSFTSSIAAASASASSFGRCRMWNASRCAVRVPTPGSRVSCATRLSTAGLSIAPLCLSPPAVRIAAAVDARSLKGLDLFSGLSSKQLDEVAKLADEVDVDAGRVLGREGEIAYEFFVIEEGTASVAVDGEHVVDLGP